MSKQITAAIVGAGHRSMIYGDYSLECPSDLKICAVAEPRRYRLETAKDKFKISENVCFDSAKALYAHKVPVDFIINGTMDQHHIETTIPALEAGYNVLLEKPICSNAIELKKLITEVRKQGKEVMICHVLRYAEFYVEIKKRLDAGEIGEIISIHSEENISYHHMATCYVRGRWSNRAISGSSVLLAKCSHDIDLISWYKAGIKPMYVSSFGGRRRFTEEKAPVGSGTRCLVDCKIEKECPYSAKSIYVDKDLWYPYVWERQEKDEEKLTAEERIASLKENHAFGKCVYHCENNVADQQSVMVEFEDGCVATHCFNVAAKPCRNVHIVGTKGEIIGTMEDNFFVVRHYNLIAGTDYVDEKVEISMCAADKHGGGDFFLMQDCVATMRGEKASISCTTLEDSINGHLIVFAADESMEKNKVIKIEHF